LRNSPRLVRGFGCQQKARWHAATS